MNKAILLIDHGSKVQAANDMLEDIAALIREISPDVFVFSSHMELAEPDIATGVEKCVSQGAREIIAVPYMLSPGRHATKDIPRMVNEAAEKYPDVSVEVTSPLGVHKKLAEVVLERARLLT